MCNYVSTAVALGVIFSFATPSRAEDAKAIIEKAIKSCGGADALAKSKAVRTVAKGTVKIMGQPVSFTEISTLKQPNQLKKEVTLEAMGRQEEIGYVFDGKQGWFKNAMGVQEVPEQILSEFKNSLHAARVAMLTPLLDDKSFTLTVLGEVRVKDKPAVGVKVSSKDHQDIDLYFDETSGLVVKIMREVRGEGGRLVMEERYLSDFKDFGGLKRATKIYAELAGEKYSEGEVVEVKFLDKIDDKEFSKP
jgi:hypothetical protein